MDWARRPAGRTFGTALSAAAAYAATVFAVGVCLGTLRVLMLAPRLGEVGAVLLELPLMIGASLVLARWSTARFGVAARPGLRLVMGAAAFALLMALEAALAILGFGRAPGAHFAGYLDLAAWPGLAAQLLFAALPALILLLPRSRDGPEDMP